MDEATVSVSMTKGDAPPIWAALDDVTQVIERAEHLAKQLVEKIDPILTPAKDDEARLLERIEAECSPIVVALRERGDQIRRLADRLEEALVRIEV